MKYVRLVGDVHGRVDHYGEVVRSAKHSIQLGDFGFKREWEWLDKNVDPVHHKVIPGNHDDYTSLTEHAFRSYGMENFHGMEFFYVRGGHSIDRSIRTIGLDFWEEEELPWTDLHAAVDSFSKAEPSLVLSHDCPVGVFERMFTGVYRPNRTQEALSAMYNNCSSPRLWIFGHHHITRFMTIDNTLFLCIQELDYVDYDVNKSVDENARRIVDELTERRFGLR